MTGAVWLPFLSLQCQSTDALPGKPIGWTSVVRVPEFTLLVGFKKTVVMVLFFDEWVSVLLREVPGMSNCSGDKDHKDGLLTGVQSEETN